MTVDEVDDVDEKDEKLLDKKVNRRGFLGALGGVAAAAAIPLSWNIANATPLEELPHTEGPEPLEKAGISEIQQSPDSEYWEGIDGVKDFEGTLTGTWNDYDKPTIQISKYLEHPDWGWKNTNDPILIGRYDLQAYDMTVYADVVENTAFGEEDRSYYTRGLKESEVHCTFYGESYITELVKQVQRKLHVMIDLGKQSPMAFEFDAFMVSVEHTLPGFVTEYYSGGPILGEVTFRSLGDVKRVYKRRITE